MPKPTQAGTEALKKKIAALPRGPGVYLLKDANGRVLYVGKAGDLRTRVRSYLHPEQDTRASAPFLSAKVTDVDFIATSNEKEALILEDTQIKRHRPRYNVKLRDDKAYLCIRVDLDHEWPRLGMVRRIKRDGAVYFGPFSDAKAVRRTLRTLGNVFPLRLCSDRTLVTRDRPCLYHQLQRCCAPCVDLVEQAEYQRMVKGLLEVLRGKVSGLLRSLERQMAAASQAQQYERAASLRDQIEAVRRTTQAQHVMSADLRDRDIVGLQRRGEVAVAMVLHVREGRLISKRGYPMRTLLPDGAILERVLGQIYRAGRLVPPEVLLPAELEDPQAAVERLRELRGGAVRLRVPKRGAGRALLDLAERNALSALEHAEGDERQRQALLQALGDRLALAAVPQRIECYDISNLQGAEMVGSRAVFQDGLPDKESYRRFKIRSVQGQDDFAALREVLQRRFATAEVAPDLIIVDGGAGQRSGALERIPDGVA
ncbi:MAG: excinuclease ABC subunit UvrC, partial [Planctomycetota bacterium]